MDSYTITITILISLLVILVLAILFLYMKINQIRKYENKEKVKSETDNLEKKEQDISQNIQKEMPNLNLDELKSNAIKCLESVFSSIENRDLSYIRNMSKIVDAKIRTIIESQKKLDLEEFFVDKNYKKVAVLSYTKNSGYYSIVFKVSLDYKHYILKNEQVVDGSKIEIKPDNYIISIAYIYDMENMRETLKDTQILGLKCTSCFADVKLIDQKYCEYCSDEINLDKILPWIMLDFERS